MKFTDAIPAIHENLCDRELQNCDLAANVK
jgi:hypothetical protein